MSKTTNALLLLACPVLAACAMLSAPQATAPHPAGPGERETAAAIAVATAAATSTVDWHSPDGASISPPPPPTLVQQARPTSPPATSPTAPQAQSPTVSSDTGGSATLTASPFVQARTPVPLPGAQSTPTMGDSDTAQSVPAQPTQTPTLVQYPSPAAPPAPGGSATLTAVSAFLQALQQDPGGKAAREYLSISLRQIAKGGRPLNQILGLPDNLSAFEVQEAHSGLDANLAVVRAQLEYDNGPLDRDIVLTRQQGQWRVTAIVGPEGERVAAAYFQAIALNRPDQAAALLSPSARLNPSLSKSAAGLDDLSVVQVQLVDATLERLVYRVVLVARLTGDATQAGEWQRGTNVRLVQLGRFSGDWQIVQITAA